jgi:hypothetical protein
MRYPILSFRWFSFMTNFRYSYCFTRNTVNLEYTRAVNDHFICQPQLFLFPFWRAICFSVKTVKLNLHWNFLYPQHRHHGLTDETLASCYTIHSYFTRLKPNYTAGNATCFQMQ